MAQNCARYSNLKQQEQQDPQDAELFLSGAPIFRYIIGSIVNKWVLIFGASIALLFSATAALAAEPVKIILDTDIASDVDDVGAVAVLHMLADEGKADILAMMISSGNPWSPLCLDALNTWYGRPDVPIGVVSKAKMSLPSKYARAIAENYRHDLKYRSDALDATRLYRQVLEAQPDNNVVIVSIGYLTNLNDLLLSRADDISCLDGMELVKKKVKMLVCMGGQYPSGREWNFYHDVISAQSVVSKWPSLIVFCGFEIGIDVLTGSGLRKMPNNPLYLAYKLYNGLNNRPSWDQIAVLCAVSEFGSPSWVIEKGGYNHVLANGANRWVFGPLSKQRYLVKTLPPKNIAHRIEAIMMKSILTARH